MHTGYDPVLAAGLVVVVVSCFVVLIIMGLKSAPKTKTPPPFTVPDHGPDLGLDKEADAFIGSFVWAFLHDGNRAYLDPKTKRPIELDLLPDPFRFRLLRFVVFTSRGERRGAIGRIEHSGHPFDELWVAFVPRWIGSWNFTGSVGPCNITVGTREPLPVEDVWKSFPDEVRVWSGMGDVKHKSEEEA